MVPFSLLQVHARDGCAFRCIGLLNLSGYHMTYYTLLIYVSLLLFDLLILNLVWRALKGPNRLTELSAAVVSFTFIAVAVVMTYTALSTTVEAAKLTRPIPDGKYISHGKTSHYRGYNRPCYSANCSRNRSPRSFSHRKKNSGWHSTKRTPLRK